MAEKAKMVRQAAADSARNPRHNLELVGALLIGANVADQEQIESIMSLLSSVGVESEYQILAGLAALLVARVLSFLKRRKQGDPE